MTTMESLKKWAPILDAMKVTDEKKREFMAQYAEYHSKSEVDMMISIKPDTTPKIIQQHTVIDTSYNLLPISLKVLTMINFDGKNVQLKDGLEVKTFRFAIDKDWVDEYKERTGLNWVQKVENILLNYLADTINNELKTKNNLYIQSMCHTMSLKNEGTEDEPRPMMILYSRYETE